MEQAYVPGVKENHCANKCKYKKDAVGNPLSYFFLYHLFVSSYTWEKIERKNCFLTKDKSHSENCD